MKKISLLFILVACSTTDKKIPLNSYHPSLIHPNIVFTHALFKTNFSGTYNTKNDSVLIIGQYLLNFQDGYSIETSPLNHEFFVFNIIYTNNTLTRGIKKIIFTNGLWDGFANFHTLEISSPNKAYLNNLLIYYIETPDQAHHWKAGIQIQDNKLFFMGTNIATKNP
ncbi:MAG: hypothetical protein ACRC0X_00265 [Brevinema sp.]